ncbi:MAG TPA: TonB-dependent siderophore receptor [Vicinamibacteria bacterium]|jgi:TonB-dependent siderophore receptor
MNHLPFVRTTLAQALALALGLGLGATAALAEEPSASPSPGTDTPRREESVDVEAELPAVPPTSTAATRLPVAVEDVPLSLSVVPASLLRDQAAFVLSDALRNVSGANAAVSFNVFDAFTVRGFDSLTGGLVLTDGVAEPEATFYPLYNVRQVEVLKGPASFLYGGNPLAGAVQIVRKQPGNARFAEISATYGRFDTFEGSLDANAASADGRLSFRLNGVWQGTDSHREIGDGSIAAVNPSLTWRPDDATRLNASFEYARSDWPPDAGLPFVGESGETLAPVSSALSYQSPFDFSEQDVYRVRVEAERRLGGITLRDRFYYTELGWDSSGTLLSGVFPFPDGRQYVIRNLVSLEDRQRLLGNQLELTAGFRTGPVGHDLVFGLETSRLADTFVQDVALLGPVDMLAPVEDPNAPPPVTLPAFGQAGDGRAVVIAPYLVDRLALSSKWQAFAGARLDHIDFEDLPRSDRADTQFSPVLGLVFSPTGDVALHASAGTGFAPPSTQVAGEREPETSRQVEAGLKVKLLAGKAFVGAAGYAIERENIAIPDGSGLLSQAGDQRSRGFEVDLSAELSPGLISYASYAFTDAELTSFAELVLTPVGPMLLERSGNTPPFAPRHMANVWLSKEFTGGLGLAAGVRALSSQFVAEDNRYSIGGYATLDGLVSYRIGRARLAVNLKNITGTDYATRGFGGVAAIPGRPFEILGRIDVGFGQR